MNIIRGRINRAVYWFALLLVIGTVATLRVIGYSATLQEVILIGLGIPRLHDVGLSGWWVLVPVGIEVASLVVGIAVLPREALMMGPAFGVLIIGSLMLWLGALAGTPGDNRFGPAPRPWLGGFSTPPKPAHPGESRDLS